MGVGFPMWFSYPTGTRFTGARTMVQDWTREQLEAAIAADEIIIVDVREPHEFAMGHIPGAVLLPLSQFDPASLPVGEGKRVVLSCAAGIRSRQAIEIAQMTGVPVDTHYIGGFRDWLMAGNPVERG